MVEDFQNSVRLSEDPTIAASIFPQYLGLSKMRLLNAKDLIIEDFSQGFLPPYAILSHTWGHGEVSFQDVEQRTATSKAGYSKLRASCEQALKDGLDYIWIDTCCIDKSSSTELSEAINSMFRFYQEAAVCYAFLADVPNNTTFSNSKESFFANSRWFTRGWTLQELLAPANLEFYSNTWQRLGTKADLSKIISHTSGIDETFLRGRPLASASIAARMSWAAPRETTRAEDRAYSLLGIFGVHIPLLYGEGGKNAFIRLQEELVRTSDDQSIFAWHQYGPYAEDVYNISWLASSPADFLGCHDIVVCNKIQLPSHFFMTNTGIRMELPIVFNNEEHVRRTFAVLECRRPTDYWSIFAVPVVIRGDKCVRADPSIVVFDRIKAASRSILFTLHLETRQSHRSPTQSLLLAQNTSMLVFRSIPDGYRIHSVIPNTGWTAWSDTSGRLLQSTGRDTSEVCSVITIAADGSIDVPFDILCIVLRARPRKGLVTTKHTAALIEPGSFGLLSEQKAGVQSKDFLTSPSQSIQSMHGMVYLQIRPDPDFQYDMDVLDVVFDDSFGRRVRAQWAILQNWILSHTLRQREIFYILYYAISLSSAGVSTLFVHSWKSGMIFTCCQHIIGIALAFLLGAHRRLLLAFSVACPYSMLCLYLFANLRRQELFYMFMFAVTCLMPIAVSFFVKGQWAHILYERAFPLFSIMVYLQRWDSRRNDRMVDPTRGSYVEGHY